MTKELLREYIDSGREIEFKYNDKMYSITYGTIDEKEVISFCEFYKKSVEVDNFEELTELKYADVSVLEMWQSATEDEVWIT